MEAFKLNSLIENTSVSELLTTIIARYAHEYKNLIYCNNCSRTDQDYHEEVSVARIWEAIYIIFYSFDAQ